MILISVNGAPREVPTDLTVAGLLRELRLDPAGVAVAINQQVVPRADHESCALRAGDRVEIIRAVGGG